MDDQFEEQYMDLLQNIEFVIIGVYRANPDAFADHHVDKVLSKLRGVYKAEQRGRDLSEPGLKPSEEDMFNAVHTVCEWRLGRADLETLQPEDGSASIGFVTDSDEGLAEGPRNSLDEIIAGLKRIQKSVRTWSKRGGRKGYLEYVDQFIR